MLRKSILATIAIACVACNESETIAPSSVPESRSPETVQSGHLIQEFTLSPSTKVRFRENQGAISLSLEGAIEDQQQNRALEEKLMNAPSMEAAFRLLDKQNPVPQALLDYDKRPIESAQEEAPPPSAKELGPVSTGSSALSKTAAGLDDTWDWVGDANWWKGTVVGNPCGWHKTHTYTNVWWADDWRQGWFSEGYLMAAGFTYAADAYAYVWKNNAWVQTDYIRLSPRYYVAWFSGDKTKRYRRYSVTSLGGSSGRVHWGMRWDTQAPSDLGVICQG